MELAEGLSATKRAKPSSFYSSPTSPCSSSSSLRSSSSSAIALTSLRFDANCGQLPVSLDSLDSLDALSWPLSQHAITQEIPPSESHFQGKSRPSLSPTLTLSLSHSWRLSAFRYLELWITPVKYVIIERKKLYS